MLLLLFSLGNTLYRSDVFADSQPETGSGILPLEEVVVMGRRPGPPLWRVTSGDHTLWVFGTVSPLPRSLEWDESSFNHLLDAAGGMLLPPSLSMSTSNPLRAIGLLRRFNAAKKLPRGEELQSVLTEESSARLHKVIERYGLKARAYRRLRPLFAGEALLKDALSSIALESDDRLLTAVIRMAKRHDVPLVKADVGVEIDEGLGYFESISAEDSHACFEAVLGALDQDVDVARKRAVAWADGDASGLSSANSGAIRSTCRTTPLDGAGAADARLASRVLWLDSAEALLTDHEVAIAVLPIDEILGPQGLMAEMQSRGYELRGQGLSGDNPL